MSDPVYNFNKLRTPPEADIVATLDAEGNPLQKDGTVSPGFRYTSPDNFEDPATVDLSALSYPPGTMVTIEDTQGATANVITVTPDGSLVDVAGDAVGQLVIDADDGYAAVLITTTTTVILASKGVDLTP